MVDSKTIFISHVIRFTLTEHLKNSFQFEGELRLPRNLIIAKLKKIRDVIKERSEFVLQKAKADKKTSATEHNDDDASSSAKSVSIERTKAIKIIPKRPYHERTTFSRVIVSPKSNRKSKSTI